MKIDLWPVMYFPGVDTGIAGSSDIISCKMKAQDNAKKKKKKSQCSLCWTRKQERKEACEIPLLAISLLADSLIIFLCVLY